MSRQRLHEQCITVCRREEIVFHREAQVLLRENRVRRREELAAIEYDWALEHANKASFVCRRCWDRRHQLQGCVCQRLSDSQAPLAYSERADDSSRVESQGGDGRAGAGTDGSQKAPLMASTPASGSHSSASISRMSDASLASDGGVRGTRRPLPTRSPASYNEPSSNEDHEPDTARDLARRWLDFHDESDNQSNGLAGLQSTDDAGPALSWYEMIQVDSRPAESEGVDADDEEAALGAAAATLQNAMRLHERRRSRWGEPVDDQTPTDDTDSSLPTSDSDHDQTSPSSDELRSQEGGGVSDDMELRGAFIHRRLQENPPLANGSLPERRGGRVPVFLVSSHAAEVRNQPCHRAQQRPRPYDGIGAEVDENGILYEADERGSYPPHRTGEPMEERVNYPSQARSELPGAQVPAVGLASLSIVAANSGSFWDTDEREHGDHQRMARGPDAEEEEANIAAAAAAVERATGERARRRGWWWPR